MVFKFTQGFYIFVIEAMDVASIPFLAGVGSDKQGDPQYGHIASAMRQEREKEIQLSARENT